jgi:hypothetical protein
LSDISDDLISNLIRYVRFFNSAHKVEKEWLHAPRRSAAPSSSGSLNLEITIWHAPLIGSV